MKILISGASGFIGSALKSSLELAGNEVYTLVRKPSDKASQKTIYWNLEKGELEPELIEGFDAIINLAGENIADERWTKNKKNAILNSRISATRLLFETVKKLKSPPKVLINASAIGYYGDRGENWVDESSPPGKGFLAEVCKEWEAATYPHAELGSRVVLIRIGVVLDKSGGVLQKMAPPFQFGLGGRLGSGEQYLSWISLRDLIKIIEFAIQTPSVSGPVNAVGPNPVKNSEFTKALGKVLSRPTFLPLPAFMVKLVFGQMGEELMLASTRVRPEKLLKERFVFSDETIEAALKVIFTQN